MKTTHFHRWHLLARSLPLFAALSLAACTAVGSLAPFTTDGCSLFPDRSIAAKTDWCDCCLAHDLAYWRGGNAEDRLKADRDIRACVERKTKDHALAETMYLGVRAGGGPHVNTPFRWGYGWPYGRGYQTLTEAEAAAAKVLEDTYRAKNPKLQCQADKPAAELKTSATRGCGGHACVAFGLRAHSEQTQQRSAQRRGRHRYLHCALTQHNRGRALA